MRPLRYAEAEFLVEAAVVYNDTCRALAWLKHLTHVSAKKYKLSLDVSLKPKDAEDCEKKYCIRGDACIPEKRQVEISYQNLCREPEKYSKPDEDLKCGYWRHLPQFYWKPLKIEWMKQNPPVIIYVQQKTAKFHQNKYVHNIESLDICYI